MFCLYALVFSLLNKISTFNTCVFFLLTFFLCVCFSLLSKPSETKPISISNRSMFYFKTHLDETIENKNQKQYRKQSPHILASLYRFSLILFFLLYHYFKNDPRQSSLDSIYDLFYFSKFCCSVKYKAVISHHVHLSSRKYSIFDISSSIFSYSSIK